MKRFGRRYEAGNSLPGGLGRGNEAAVGFGNYVVQALARWNAQAQDLARRQAIDYPFCAGRPTGPGSGGFNHRIQRAIEVEDIERAADSCIPAGRDIASGIENVLLGGGVARMDGPGRRRGSGVFLDVVQGNTMDPGGIAG